MPRGPIPPVKSISVLLTLYFENKGRLTLVKKRFVWALIAAILLICGCQTEHQFQYAQALDQVARVVIVTEENGNQILRESTPDLLVGLQRLPCKSYWNDPCDEIGKNYIVIEYKNGDREFIGASANYYEINGKFRYGHEYFDDEDFLSLLDEH